VRHLHEERFVRLNLRFHESVGLARHAEDALRVARIFGVAFGVAGFTVVHVVTVLARAAAVHVPLAQVRGGVAEPLEVFADRVVSRVQAAQG